MRNPLANVFFIALFSCGQPTSTTSENAANVESTQNPQTEEGAKSQEIQLAPFELSSLPSNWISLTETDSATIIYNTCDGGNLLLTIELADSTILFHGQQEDVQFEFLKYGISRDSVIHFVMSESEGNYLTFTWTDKKRGLGNWDLSYYYLDDGTRKELFVSRKNERDFISVVQPCRECWDDEICDQIEARSH